MSSFDLGAVLSDLRAAIEVVRSDVAELRAGQLASDPNGMTVEQTATALGVSEEHVRRLIARREIPAAHFGAAVRISRSWIAEHLRGEHKQ